MRNNMQRGFSLVTAIFLLVVLAGLGAMMVTFSTTQNQALALDVLGSRAYQAAQAGVEWAAYNITLNPAAAVSPPGTTVSLGGNLAPFNVSVNYDATPHIDAANAGAATGTLYTHDITATATYGNPGSADYVERVVKAKM